MAGRNRGFNTCAIVVAASWAVAWPVSLAAQGLDEIVVTARKREESLQDVPLSISAFSAEQLRERGISNNYEVSTFTVNFSTLPQLGRRLDRPIIRGQPAASASGEPNASYFIDGVFVSGSVSTASTAAMERVEILRGPQSAQFGRATFSGAVNYVTRKPTNDFQGELNAKAGTNEDYRLAGWVSGPLIQDKLLYFLSGSFEKYGGQWNNGLEEDSATFAGIYLDAPQEADSSDLGGTETTDFVGKLTFTPFESTEISFKYSYTEGDDDHFPSLVWDDLNCYIPEDPNDPAPASAKPPFSNQFIDQSAPNWSTSAGAYCGTVHTEGKSTRVNLPDLRNGITHGGALTSPNPEDFTAAPSDPGTRRETDRFLLEYVQDIGDWEVITRGTYNEEDFSQTFDLDRTNARTLFGLFHRVTETDFEDYSVEFRVASPIEARLRGQVGAYLYDLDRVRQDRQYTGINGNRGQFAIVNEETTRNEAVFGMLEFDLAESLTLAVEGRYAEDEKTILSGNGVSAESTFENFTPRLTLEYKANDDMLLYALTAKGNKPGDFNTAYFQPDVCVDESLEALADGRATIDEEEAWTYEFGAKTSWLENRATANLAVFYIDWTNQGVFRTRDVERCPDPNNPDNVTLVETQVVENAGKSRNIGFELDTSFVVNEFMTVSASYGYTDAEFVEFNDDGYALLTGIDDPELLTGGNVAGQQVANVPEHQVVIGVDARRPVTSSLEGFFRADFVYESERYTDVGEFLKADDRKIVNVRIGASSENWTITGYVTNLLDETPPAANLQFFDQAQPPLPNGEFENLWTMSPTRGRDWGVELQYRF